MTHTFEVRFEQHPSDRRKRFGLRPVCILTGCDWTGVNAYDHNDGGRFSAEYDGRTHAAEAHGVPFVVPEQCENGDWCGPETA